MNLRIFISALLFSLVFISCNHEIECSYVPLQPAFIGFSASDLDTFVLRKFKPNDNYQSLIDTFTVDGNYSVYRTSNDTIRVLVNDATNDGKAGILHGFDWQIFIPSTNQTLTVSDIVSEQKSTKCGGLDKTNCYCTNQNFSAKYNGQAITFSNPVLDTGRYYLYIHK